jgi:spoIIIJ-associated protein
VNIMSDTITTQETAAGTFEAGTVDEAVAAGLESLGLERDEAKVEILDKGSRGFLGLGSRPAVVRVGWKVQAAAPVRELSEKLFSLMDIPASIEVEQTGREVRVVVSAGETDGLLIGRKGETLQALQHVLTRMVGKQFGEGAPEVVVDVAGYRKRREGQLRELAEGIASRVSRTGKRAMTEPLPPAERRIIHRRLDELGDVQSHTAGTGINKRVVVTPSRRQTSGR